MEVAILSFSTLPVPGPHDTGSGQTTSGYGRSNEMAVGCRLRSPWTITRHSGYALLMAVEIAVHAAHQTSCDARGQDQRLARIATRHR